MQTRISCLLALAFGATAWTPRALPAARHSALFSTSGFSRRSSLVLLPGAAAVLLAPGTPARASEAIQKFEDKGLKVSFDVPAAWEKLTDSRDVLSEDRRLVVYANKNDSDENAFIAFTPVRGDYSSIGSLGNLDAVAQNIIQTGEGVESTLLSSSVVGGSYVYNYKVNVDGQPVRHLISAISLIAPDLVSGKPQGGNTLVTLTAQCREERYAACKSEMDAILASFKVALK